MATEISDALANLNLNNTQDINILLLGETGVGKSTFINAIANYFHFKTFKNAIKASDLLILIPSVITIANENLEQVTISVGSDKNEFQEIGAAGTQDVKTYVFPIGVGKTRLRLIDSPGMGDPRGIEQDDINCENILSYLSRLSELHAICFLMKPTTTRKTILFEYCVKQILSRLEKSASRNIVFIFTNTRGTEYTPGDTLPCLKTIIDEIKSKPPHVDIPLKNNIFSVDNEAFRLLVAMKKGMKFSDSIQQRFIESWNNSAKECWRLITYITGDVSTDGLKPHHLYSTISINDARRIIVQLSQPLADISQLIDDNLRILERHTNNLNIENQSLQELRKKLFIPVLNLVVTQLTQPTTICTSAKCAEIVQVGDVRKWHYKQRCHDPCYLTNVPKEMIGDPALINCEAMNGGSCKRCTCDYKVHMHIYYMTKVVSDKIEDGIVKSNLLEKEQALKERQRLIDQINRRKQELIEERDIIIKSTAQFAHFLQHNAISPFNDSYKAYIDYLITREKSLGCNGDTEVIHNLERLLRQYEEIKAAFAKGLELDKLLGVESISSNSITPQTVFNTIEKLYQLKHYGTQIKELVKKQKSPRKSEYEKKCEYVHPQASDLSQSESKREEKKTDKKKSKDENKGKSKSDKNQKQHSQNQRQEHPQNQRQQPQHKFNYQRKGFHETTPVSREPPPSYEESKNSQRFYNNNDSDQQTISVKVEVTPKKNQKDRNFERAGRNYASSSSRQSSDPYKQPSNQFEPFPNQYGPPFNQYGEPFPAQYSAGPPSNHHPLPPNQYGAHPREYPAPPTHYGPHTNYYGPPSNHYGAPPNQYGPPSHQYAPPPGQYTQPPQNYYPASYHDPNFRPAGAGQYNQSRSRGPKNNNYKKEFKNRGGRGRSQQRSKQSGKSGTETKSSDSDS